MENLPGIVSQLQIKGWEKVLQKITFMFVRSNLCINLFQEELMISDYEEFTKYHRKIRIFAEPIESSKPIFVPEKKQANLEQVEYVKIVSIDPQWLTENIPCFFLARARCRGNNWALILVGKR